MKRVIETSKAPKAIGPYSQAVEINGMLFISGQLPLNPQSGEIVGNTIKEQTTQVLKNIEHILQDAGYSLSNVVKTTCYLNELIYFPEMNEVYAGFFKEQPPARATVEVNRLPKDVMVEIEAIAVRNA